jgi:hypothetical protein
MIIIYGFIMIIIAVSIIMAMSPHHPHCGLRPPRFSVVVRAWVPPGPRPRSMTSMHGQA